MKKIAMMVTGLALALSLCACACTNTAPATSPSNNTTPGATQQPFATDSMTVPVPETNIPDPSVDSNSTNGMTNATVGRSLH